MKTTFSHFPGMFENKLQAKYYLKKTKSKHIMKNQLYTNVAKDNRWPLVVISDWFV